MNIPREHRSELCEAQSRQWIFIEYWINVEVIHGLGEVSLD